MKKTSRTIDRILPAACVAMSVLAPVHALAQDSFVSAGDFIVRGRVIVVEPDEGSTITPIGGKVGIDKAVMPEVDFSYFITDNIAVELIAAVSPHNPKATGTALGDMKIGDLLLLPPTLTLQYHLPVSKNLKPYVGAGVNYTMFIREKADGGIVTDLNAKDSFGVALQAGADYRIKGPWMLNVDMKKLFLDTKVTVNGGAVTADVDIDPWIFGVGVGYKF